MSTTWFRWITFCFRFSPFECIQVQFVDVIERGPLVVDTSMSTEDDDLVLEVSHRVVGSGLWSSDLAHGVFGWALGFLVWRLEPLEVREFEVETVVVSFVGGVAPSEDEHLVFLHLAGRVECSSSWQLPGTGFVCPLYGLIVDDSECVEFVFG